MSKTSFPAALRIAQSVETLQGARDSLASINTSLFSDRAIVMVKENNALYMLRRESVAGEESPDVIAPDQGGPGRWFRYGLTGSTVQVAVAHAAIPPQSSVQSSVFALAAVSGPEDIVVSNLLESSFPNGVLDGDIYVTGAGTARMTFLNATAATVAAATIQYRMAVITGG